mgnify:CR=1 FL=1
MLLKLHFSSLYDNLHLVLLKVIDKNTTEIQPKYQKQS